MSAGVAQRVAGNSVKVAVTSLRASIVSVHVEPAVPAQSPPQLSSCVASFQLAVTVCSRSAWIHVRPSGVTVPSPAFVTRSRYRLGLKITCAALFASIVSTQVVAVIAAAHWSVQRATWCPASGVAVTVTLVPLR